MQEPFLGASYSAAYGFGWTSCSACCAMAAVAGAASSPSPPASCTVGKANLTPLASKAFLILARAVSPDDEILAGQSHHLHADLDREIAERVDALHFQRLEDQRLEFRLLGQLQPDLLDQLSGLVDIAVIGDADGELVDDPVAALVLHGAQQAERHRVDRTALMPQPDRADAKAFDRAFVIAALDVFADPEGIVEQVEACRQ